MSKKIKVQTTIPDLRCPVCKSKNTYTTKSGLHCRKCGYAANEEKEI